LTGNGTSTPGKQTSWWRKIITGALSDSSDFATGATVSAGTTRAVFLSAYK